jgi:hypothetical protein
MGAVGEGGGEDAHLCCARARRWRDEGEVATASSSAAQEEMRCCGRERETSSRCPDVWRVSHVCWTGLGWVKIQSPLC